MYSAVGAGVAEHLDFDAHIAEQDIGTMMVRADIRTGTLVEAYDCLEGHIAGKADLIDMIRSLAPGFIFTTSLPPTIMAASQAAVNLLGSHAEDCSLQLLHARSVREALMTADMTSIQ